MAFADKIAKEVIDTRALARAQDAIARLGAALKTHTDMPNALSNADALKHIGFNLEAVSSPTSSFATGNGNIKVVTDLLFSKFENGSAVHSVLHKPEGLPAIEAALNTFSEAAQELIDHGHQGAFKHAMASRGI